MRRRKVTPAPGRGTRPRRGFPPPPQETRYRRSVVGGPPRRPSTPLAALVVAALIFAWGTVLVAQPASEPASGEVFFESLNVTLVNVEVHVTDKQGRRVAGLTPKDFRVLVDGREVEITNFYAVEGGEPAPPPADEPPSGDPARTPPPAGAPEIDPLPGTAAALPPVDQRLSLVVYFDNLHIRPFNRNKVVRLVRSFLQRHLAPGDRAMLVTFERSLHVRLPFTADLATFSSALDEVERLTGFGVQAASARREAIRRIEDSRSTFEAEGHAEDYAESTYDDAARSIEAVKDLVGSLAGLPGRKALLYVSDGLPMTPGEEMFTFLDLRHGQQVAGQIRAARYRLRRRFEEMIAQANANRVTFYTLQAEGAASRPSLSAEYGGTQDSYLEIDVIRQANLQEPLMLMAEGTGGLAAVGTNNLQGVLDQVANDLGTYYSLGFRPVSVGDGRYHEIEVEVLRPGLEVRHRTGYRDRTPEARLADGTLAALLYGAEVNPLGIEIVADGTPKRRDDGHLLVPLAVRIPLGEVALVPQGEAHRAALRVALAVADDEGGRTGVQQAEVPITVPAAELERARGQHFVYAVELVMRPGRQLVAVGVRDDLSGETSFLRRPFRVGG